MKSSEADGKGETERAAQSISPSIDQLMCCSEDVILPETEGKKKKDRRKHLETQRGNYKEGRGEGRVNDIKAIDLLVSG